MATTEEMKPLHPDQRAVLMIRAGAVTALLTLAAAVADWVTIDDRLPLGAAPLAVLVLAGGASALFAARRYRAWGYAMGEDELQISRGLLFQARTVVPFGRVQHIDVVQGPLQRTFGIGTLVLHTAGTRSAAVHLPGLAAIEAERMRDHIRGKIREDLA
ncbi:PH domain-containing protein [Allosphingosinicella sp.]|uniref:PH domain-containing protein n=1 Tax=Allosphingosinicella sp. TaxID=2823234 RepID=UPI002EFDC1B6